MDSASYVPNSTQGAASVRSSSLSSVPLRLRLATIYGALSSLALTFALISGYGFYERAAFRNYDGTLSFALSIARPALDQARTLEPPRIGAPLTLREYDAKGRLVRSGGAPGAPVVDVFTSLASAMPAHAAWIGLLPAVGSTTPNYTGFWLGVADGQRWRALTSRLPDGRIVQLLVPLGQTDAALGRVRRNFFVVGLMGAFVVFGLGYALSGPSLRPLTHFARAVERLVRDPDTTLSTSSDQDLSPLAQSLSLAFQNLRDRERFVSGVLAATPSLVYVYDPKSDKNVYSNEQLGPLLGYSSESMMNFERGFVESLVHPEDRLRTREHLRRVASRADGTVHINEYRVLHADGSWHWFLSRDVSFERDPNGLVKSILGVADDVTERKRADANAQFLLQLDAKLREAQTPLEIEEVATRTLGEYLGASRCLIGALNGEYVTVGHDWTSDAVSSAGHYRLSDYFTPEAAGAFSNGEQSVIEDVRTDPRTRDQAQKFLAFACAASIDVPLFGSGGWAGILSVHKSKAHQWRTDEIELVNDVATRVWPELERARAVEALNESRARLEAALESSRTAVWELDTATDEIVYAGDFGPFHGLPSGPGRVSIQQIRALTPAEDEADNLLIFARALETNQVFEAEYRVIVPGRPERWLLSRGRQQNTADGRTRISGTHTDITERKRAEQAVLERETRYRTLFDSIDQGFCICEMILDDAGQPHDYRFLEVNPTFERQTGLVDAAGKTALELVPDLEPHWFETYGRVALTGEAANFVDGSEAMGRWFDVYACRVGGSQSLRFAVLFTDITERRRSEEALRSSEERYRALTLATTQFVWQRGHADNNTETLRWWADLTGMPPEESSGMGWLESLHPDDRERAQKAWTEAFEHGTFFSTDYRVRSKDGRYVHLEVRGVPTPGENGELEWIGTFTDVTSERSASERLLEINEAQRRFVGDASHELRAPLTSIQGNLELLIRYPNMSPKDRADAMADAMAEARRMGRLVQDLLAVARGESSHAQRGPMKLEQALEAAWRVAQTLSDQKQFELGSLEAAVVDGDPDQIKQLTVILLENAVKYTPDGGTVRLSSGVVNGHAEFKVTDTGFGISTEDVPRVFERFYRADQARFRGDAPGGTGLGLTIAKRIAESHGGSVSLESSLGHGTSVTVRLPLAADEA